VLEENVFESLRLPAAPRIVLQRSPLALALCQVRFSSILGVAESAFVAPFQRAIQDRYPIATLTNQVQLLLGVGMNQAAVQQQLGPQQWTFSDREDIWKIVLTQDFLSIETRLYNHFDEFMDRLRLAITALIEHIRPSLVTRLGLRYINEIRVDDEPWTGIIEPQMLGLLTSQEFASNSLQAIQEVQLRYRGESGINIHQGLLPRGTTVPPRAGAVVPEGPFYLLDFDVFREYPLPRGLPVEADTIYQQSELYHDVIYRLFRWSVTDRYLSMCGVQHDDVD